MNVHVERIVVDPASGLAATTGPVAAVLKRALERELARSDLAARVASEGIDERTVSAAVERAVRTALAP